MTDLEMEPAETGYGPAAPQDLLAEQSVLGGLMLSSSARLEVLGGHLVAAVDFYRPIHETIFVAVAGLDHEGGPVDAVTVAGRLTRMGELVRVGGHAYLHTLISQVPTAANAAYYARIVRERAVLRRLIEAGQKVVQLGYAAQGGDADELVAAAKAEVAAVEGVGTTETVTSVEELVVDLVGRLESPESADTSTSWEWPWLDFRDGYDHLPFVLPARPGQLVVFGGRPGSGKALALDTPLPTPSGWTTMGDVQVGDQVLGADGRATRVIWVSEVMHERTCYRVTFSDGTSVIADAQHQWFTSTRASRKAESSSATKPRTSPFSRDFRWKSERAGVKTTKQIAATLFAPGKEGRCNHRVETTAPLDLPVRDLPVAPYTLGAWLGDGHSAAGRITSADPEIIAHIETDGYVVRKESRLYGYAITTDQAPDHGRNDGTCPRCGGKWSGYGASCRHCRNFGFTSMLRRLGVLNDKHIPLGYLRASERQRRDMLAGLLDTDGTASRRGGRIEYATTSSRLADDVVELIASLGYRPGISRKRVRGRAEATSTAFTVGFVATDQVFRLSRKAITHKESLSEDSGRRVGRMIVAVDPVPSVPVRCIQVDNEDHLYLATKAMIPTHNSTALAGCVRQWCVLDGVPTVLFSKEMPPAQWIERVLSAQSRVPLKRLKAREILNDEWTRVYSASSLIAAAPLTVVSQGGTLADVVARVRKHEARIVAYDYIQLAPVGAARSSQDRQMLLGGFVQGLKDVALTEQVLVLTAAQLNRPAASGVPSLENFRETGAIEQAVDLAVLLHPQEKESARAGEVDFIVGKQRDGETGTVALAAQLHLARFVDMAR